MSTPVIFVASITAIAVFVTPGLYEPATLLRIGTVLLAGLAGRWDWQQRFSAFCSASSAPKHWVCRILRRTPSRSSRFPRTAFCAATTGSCPGMGSISGKSGRGGNGGHEAANRTFYPGGVDLSLVTAALADGIPQSVPVRRALWLGVVSAVCLCILSALAVAMLQNKAPSFAVRLALTAGLFMELMHTLAQAQGLCTAEFSSMALLGFLPLLLWAGGASVPQAGTPRRGCCGGL